MPLMSSIVDAALAEAYGYAQTVDRTTYLTAGISATDLTIPVVDASGFSRGLVQVGDELMIVDEVDRSANSLKIGFVSGRGVRGTTPTSHSTGDLVTMAPSIPRHQVVEAVEEAIRGASGLFRVADTTIVAVGSQGGYALPVGAKHILDARWYPPGPSDEWIPLRRYQHDKYTGQIVVHDGVAPGCDIKVTYAADPIVPTQSQDFSVSGLPDSCVDVIRLGAIWRVVSFLEPYNLLAKSAEMEAMDRQKSPGTRLRVSQYYYGLYQQRLQQEVGSLQSSYPIRVSFGTW